MRPAAGTASGFLGKPDGGQRLPVYPALSVGYTRLSMVQQGRIEREGTSLHYLDWNPEAGPRPAVLLLHGLSSNATFWTRVATRLPDRRLIAMDQRAHGSSDAPDDGYEPATLAADAAALVEELELGRVVVAGHSWGGTIALQLSADRPDLVSGLAVIDGPVRPWSETGLSWADAERFMQPPLPVYSRLEEAVAEKQAMLKAAWQDDLVEFVKAGLVAEGAGFRLPLTGPIRHQILHAMFFQPYDLLWTQVSCPVLLALARQSGESTFAEFKRKSAAMIAGQVPGTAVHWYESGHDIPLERPEEIAVELERLCLRAAFADVTAEIGEVEVGGPGAGRAEHGRHVWDAPTGYLDWTAKDLLAHLSSTQAALPAVAASRRGTETGGRSEKFDGDRWNASQIRRRKETPAAELLAELRKVAAEMDPILAELPVDEIIGAGPYAGETAAAAMGNMVKHQREHLAELKRSLAAASV